MDCFVLDDLYKDALEANSPLVRANCWEWYTSVVRTRMHNASRELVVFTRWHEEDLIGALAVREPVEELRAWSQLDTLPADRWLHLNFEALKTAPPTEVDPRQPGEALWERQHGAALLEAKRRLDPLQFEAMYQGRPSAREGLLYGLNFAEYDCLPHEIVRRANYTDTADTGDDYLCSLSYAVDADGVIYITDAVYSREPMEATEPLVGEMLVRSDTRQAAIESNNGGRGFARAVQALAPGVRVEWFHQSGNKDPLQFGHGAPPRAFSPRLEPPLARTLRPSDDLPPEVSRQPMARRGGCRDGHRRARGRRPGAETGPRHPVFVSGQCEVCVKYVPARNQTLRFSVPCTPLRHLFF